MSTNARKIVLIATLFNLLFEYSMRGVNNLARQPFLPFVLILIYASLFTMQEDLIRRFKLRDVHLMVLPFIYGTLYQAFVSGAAFLGRTLLGVNWGSIAFVLVIWWGALQAVLTFYIANRIVPRDWAAPPLSRAGWALALAANLAAILLFQLSGAVPHGTPIGYLMIALICAAGLIALRRIWPAAGSARQPFERRMALDVLAVITILVFLFSAVFLTRDPTLQRSSLVNRSATIVVSIWTTLLAVALFIERLKAHREIPV